MLWTILLSVFLDNFVYSLMPHVLISLNGVPPYKKTLNFFGPKFLNSRQTFGSVTFR
jgi:hypothetical protein